MPRHIKPRDLQFTATPHDPLAGPSGGHGGRNSIAKEVKEGGKGHGGREREKGERRER